MAARHNSSYYLEIGPVKDAMRQALEDGASKTTLRAVATGFFENTQDDFGSCTVVGYVPMMLNEMGQDKKNVHDFFVSMCLTDFGSVNHRNAFWRGPDVWELFGSVDELVKFGADLLRREPRRKVDVERLQEIADSELNHASECAKGLIRLLKDRKVIESVSWLETEEAFELLIRQTYEVQRASLKSIELRGWGLVFAGYSLPRGYCDGKVRDALIEKLRGMIISDPRRAPLVWRWLAEGYRRATPDVWIDGMIHAFGRIMDSPSIGLRILRVVDFRTCLGINLSKEEGMVILHDAAFEDGADPLLANSLAMVPVRWLRLQSPYDIRANNKFYVVGLLPADPPPSHMLQDWQKYFAD